MVITTPINRQTPIECSKYVSYYKKNINKTWQELTKNYENIQAEIQADDQESTASSHKSIKNSLISSTSSTLTSKHNHQSTSSSSVGSLNKYFLQSQKLEINPISEIFTSNLEQIFNGISVISIEATQRGWNEAKKEEIYQFTDMHLPALLCEIDSSTLAEYFFRCDLTFFGINSKTAVEISSSRNKLRSCIEFALLPIGKQFRRDVIVRNECLKYFVIATLLKQTNCFVTQIELLSKWIRIAAKLGLDFGDQFGFGSIMYGLLDSKIGRQKTLWHDLKARDIREFQLFESCLVPKFLALLDSSLEICSKNVTLPFLISIFHMIECNTISNVEFLPKIQSMSIEKMIQKEIQNERGTGLGNFSLDAILSGIVASSKIIDSLDQFEQNSIRHLTNKPFVNQCEKTMALFMTEFHLKFFFGSSVDVNKINYRIFQTLELRL